MDNMETQPVDTMPSDSQPHPASPVQPMQPLTPHASLSRASTQLDVNETCGEGGLEEPAEEECPTGDESCVDVPPENEDEVLVVDSDQECAMSPPKKTENKTGDGTMDVAANTVEAKEPDTKSSTPAQEVAQDSQPDPATLGNFTTGGFPLEESMASDAEETKDSKGTFKVGNVGYVIQVVSMFQ